MISRDKLKTFTLFFLASAIFLTFMGMTFVQYQKQNSTADTIKLVKDYCQNGIISSDDFNPHRHRPVIEFYCGQANGAGMKISFVSGWMRVNSINEGNHYVPLPSKVSDILVQELTALYEQTQHSKEFKQMLISESKKLEATLIHRDLSHVVK